MALIGDFSQENAHVMGEIKQRKLDKVLSPVLKV
jgi:hypothetical protein